MNNYQNLSPVQRTIVGVQFLFVAFGATVLVPLLVGFSTSIALFGAGVGTLVFHLITKGKVPIFLGSSFAFISPIILATEMYGMGGTLCGLIAVGGVYGAMSLLIKMRGTDFIKKLFPPIVVGPVIVLIGLSLAPTGVKMASENWILAGIALATAVGVSMFGKGLLKLIPVFSGIIVGYLVALFFFDINLEGVASASWITLPDFQLPEFSWQAILFMIPVAIAPVIEHIGDVYTINSVAKKDFVKDPGLHRTMLGDGVACMISGFIGGPPVTTYSEVTGAIQLTKITDPAVIRIAAITAILFSVLGKVSAVLQTIPGAVLGGIMLLLFGTIASVGINNMIQSKLDLTDTRNIIISSIILTIGIGGAVLQIGDFTLAGIGLAAVTGVILNLILPHTKVEKEVKKEKKAVREEAEA
ncbi:MAG: uracil-xanthine permease family protein [Marinifilaceae bacterium]